MVSPTWDVNRGVRHDQDGWGTIQPIDPHPGPSLADQGFVFFFVALVPSQASPPQSSRVFPWNKDRPWPNSPFLAERSPIGINTVRGTNLHIPVPNCAPSNLEPVPVPGPLPYTSNGRAVVYLLLRNTKLEFTPLTALSGMMCSRRSCS